MGESYYDRGLACRNGHALSGMVDSSPEHRSRFCPECGSETVDACPQCGAMLRGYYFVPGVLGGHPWEPSNFCYECGQPYPWTGARLDAARELAEVLDGLKPEEREALKRDFDDIARDTARTGVAVLRIKATLGKLGQEGAGILRSVLRELATDAAKGQLGL